MHIRYNDICKLSPICLKCNPRGNHERKNIQNCLVCFVQIYLVSCMWYVLFRNSRHSRLTYHGVRQEFLDVQQSVPSPKTIVWFSPYTMYSCRLFIISANNSSICIFVYSFLVVYNADTLLLHLKISFAAASFIGFMKMQYTMGLIALDMFRKNIDHKSSTALFGGKLQMFTV